MLIQCTPVSFGAVGTPILYGVSAGTYNIDQPEVAETLGREKAENIVSTQANLVATGNIGCMTQIKTHLARSHSRIPVRHTMQVLRDAYAGKVI